MILYPTSLGPAEASARRWQISLELKSFLILGCVAVSGCASTSKAPTSRSQGEAAPVFRADQVIPPHLVRGSNYRIAGRVPVEEYEYIFSIKSDFGDIEARGRDMLDLRLRELKSIESAKKLSKDPKVVDGVLDPLKDTGKGFMLLVTEPLESLKRAPRGFSRMVNQYTDPSDRRAGSPARRKLATELDCDPETTNPVLKKLLDDMAMQQFGGSLLTRAAISFVPGLSLLPATAEIKDTIANSPPSVINDGIDKKLEAAGVEKSIRSRFHKSAAFTTMQRLQLMELFTALNSAGDAAALLEGAAEARNQSEALGAIREGKMLVDIHKRKPIVRLEFVGMPLAVLGDQTRVIVCPYDYVTNTQELAEGVSAYRAKNPNVKTVFVSADRVSPAARKTLESANITVVEGGPSNWRPKQSK